MTLKKIQPPTYGFFPQNPPWMSLHTDDHLLHGQLPSYNTNQANNHFKAVAMFLKLSGNLRKELCHKPWSKSPYQMVNLFMRNYLEWQSYIYNWFDTFTSKFYYNVITVIFQPAFQVYVSIKCLHWENWNIFLLQSERNSSCWWHFSLLNNKRKKMRTEAYLYIFDLSEVLVTVLLEGIPK